MGPEWDALRGIISSLEANPGDQQTEQHASELVDMYMLKLEHLVTEKTKVMVNLIGQLPILPNPNAAKPARPPAPEEPELRPGGAPEARGMDEVVDHSSERSHVPPLGVQALRLHGVLPERRAESQLLSGRSRSRERLGLGSLLQPGVGGQREAHLSAGAESGQPLRGRCRAGAGALRAAR